MLGPRAHNIHEIRVLNRCVRWLPPDSAGGEAIEYEADPRHVEVLAQQMGLSVNSRAI